MPAENTIQLDDALKRRIDELAKTSGASPTEIVREAVEEFAARRKNGKSVSDSDGIWEIARRISASVPDEEWDKIPRDLSKNFDHYHYGHPRED